MKERLGERIKEKVRGFIDDLAEAIDSILSPAPEPVRIPVRKYPYY